jgi:hypothetical protein
MQYAKSLRFAGMLLDAQECDYTDFINHGLRCPNCSGTVFLVAGSQRELHSRKLKSGESVAVKGSIVPAHFSHHSTDKTQIADCELRSAKMTQVQRQAFQAQARGQVARIFRQKFFAMVKTSIKLHDFDSTNTVLLDLWQRASLKQPIAAKAQLTTFIDMLCRQFTIPGQIKHSKEGLDYAIEKWGNQITENPNGIPEIYRSQFKSWSNVLDRQMQCLIVAEAIDYVCHKSQKTVLQELMKCALYSWILGHSSNDILIRKGFVSQQQKTDIYNTLMFESVAHDLRLIEESEMLQSMIRTTRQFIGLGREEFEAIFMFVRNDIVQILTFVNWSDEFEKREKHSKQN